MLLRHFCCLRLYPQFRVRMVNCYQHLLDEIQETGAEKEEVKKKKLLQKGKKEWKDDYLKWRHSNRWWCKGNLLQIRRCPLL